MKLVLLALLLAGCGGAAADAPWVLVDEDEFDGPAGGRPDPARWSFELGGNGWGNNESQYYTDRPENAALDGAGHLVITARREAFGGRAYTSARLTTRGKRELTYGRVEARLQLPRGKGMWPAFWLLGANFSQAGWPACGEIDVMESRGAQPALAFGSLHGPGYSGGDALMGTARAPAGATFADDSTTTPWSGSPGSSAGSSTAPSTTRSAPPASRRLPLGLRRPPLLRPPQPRRRRPLRRRARRHDAVPQTLTAEFVRIYARQ
jgi:beta-glucanase (GH16 family)